MATAGELRRMARQLGLEMAPEALAGRGDIPAASDAFWIAVNRAVVDAIRKKEPRRLARLYEAQADILYEEGKPFFRLLTWSFQADLAMIETDSVAIIACGCAPCVRDDGKTVPTAEERQHPRLPHVDCENGRCSCMYTAAPYR